MAQSTNDAFPTAIKLCIILKSRKLKIALKRLSWELERKAQEFKDVLKWVEHIFKMLYLLL